MTAVKCLLILALATLPASAPADPRRLPAVPQPKSVTARPAASRMPELRDGARDFDFEIGSWHAHVARRLRPLTGSQEWVEYDGVSTVRPLWGGKGNLGELHVAGDAGEIEGISLRLYDPASRQWNVSWANSRDGALTRPLVGGFDGLGGGTFLNEDTLGGRQILARYVFTGTTGSAFRIEQSFSGDGGRTWEVNWIADFKR